MSKIESGMVEYPNIAILDVMVKRYVALADEDAKRSHRSASPADRWQL